MEIIPKIIIPEEVKFLIKKLQTKNYGAYIVGGCVRDILRGVEPLDWDIATNAKPEEIGKFFLKSFADNRFGTVTVLTESQNERLKEIEITPFRIDEKYSDKRHPDAIKWAKTIGEDLARRDFTINAIAAEWRPNLQKIKIIDPFDGQKDLENKIIKAVGNPDERFKEDALRLMRAIRFAVILGPKLWEIEKKTAEAIIKNSDLLAYISKERIRDELLKIINSLNGAKGIEILRRFGLLKHIIPELEKGFNIQQNKHHIYQIYGHSLLSLNYACLKNFSEEIRLAALLHDIGKPQTKRGEGPNATFYNHEIVGEKITAEILRRLKFPKKKIEKIAKLVRCHLFYYNVGEVGDSSVRRLLRKIGQGDDFEDLLKVRMCDRIGSGVPKAEPYKLRHLKYVAEKVSQDPISAKMLKINGYDIMKILKIPPGPKIGKILDYLLCLVLTDPKKNEKEFLKKEVEKLAELEDEKLKKLAQKSKEEIEKIETKRDEMTKKKYWVT